jgi:hypothetical protein
MLRRNGLTRTDIMGRDAFSEFVKKLGGPPRLRPNRKPVRYIVTVTFMMAALAGVSPAVSQNSAKPGALPCVDVQIGQDHAPPLNCLNDTLAPPAHPAGIAVFQANRREQLGRDYRVLRNATRSDFSWLVKPMLKRLS